MSRFFLYILISFLVFFSLACRKYTMKTNVEGTVVDITTGNSIPYAKVEIHAEERGSILGYAPYKGVQYTTDANAEGEYSFEFKANKEYSYFVTAKKENYFFDEFPGTTPDNIYVSIENAKKNKDLKVKLTPKAWLNLNFKNVNNNYSITINNPFGGGGLSFYGYQLDTTILGSVSGNKTTDFFYWVIKNDTIRYQAFIYCPAFDTTNFNINF